MLRSFAFAVVCFASLAAGCASQSPELRVLGVHEVHRQEVVVVQVTNPAGRAMRLTKLEYRFASAGGATVAEGELALAREVPAGAAVVVEVPFESFGAEPVTLRGKLTAELDEIVKIFKVSARLAPRS